MTPVQPSIGQWYLNKDLGRRFEVVSIDEEGGTIELQDEEGFLDEMGRDEWLDAELEFTVQPESLSEVFDDLSEPDEVDGTETDEPDTGEESLRLVGSELSDESSSEEDDLEMDKLNAGELDEDDLDNDFEEDSEENEVEEEEDAEEEGQDIDQDEALDDEDKD